ncbi:MAG: 23S rRNA (adenine(2030)-N(6))-methyltransferase RlmJ, partial [Methylococcaceae bacterium]|nr:23S rRNA (adenine(2030)-N(6))-methyltransferase RlmJ [Methylococcaceae bacterium]
MLSYRHAFHAGNFADVLKHLILIHVIEHLKKKDKPFCYLDTHAGAGLYSLAGEYA